jgi:hypothetical protein
MLIDEGSAGGVDTVIDATPAATNEHDAAIAEVEAAAAVDIAEVQAEAAVETTEAVVEAEAAATETERGVMEILSLHGENIAGLRSELAEARAENTALLSKVVELLARDEEEEVSHAEEIHTENLPPEGGNEGGEGGGGEGGESGGGREESPPEARRGRRYSRHFG